MIAAEIVLAPEFTRPVTFDGTPLKWARIVGGPSPLVDQKTDWPCHA